MSKESAQAIFDEWKKNHAWNKEFELVDAFMVDGEPMVLFVNHYDNETPYSVQYRGNGHYFKREVEAWAWMLYVRR